MAKERKAAIGFIFLTIVIDVTGLGIIIPVLPKLIKELTAGDTSEAAQWGGWLVAIYAIMQFLLAPLIGSLSDKYGRRPILLLSLIGFGIDYILLAIAPNIWFLVVARILSGVMGASMTSASAYIADISTHENRAKNFGMLGAAFGLGFIIGPVMGGLLGEFGSRVPFWAASVLAFLNAAYGYFILPESLSKENRRDFSWKTSNPFTSILNLKKYGNLLGLILAYFILFVGAHAVQTNWSYFTIEKFNWSEGMIGISLGVVGLLVAIVQGGLLRYINPKIGNEKSIYLGYSLYIIGLALFALASEGWMMFLFLIPYCMGGISGPALQSIMATKVPANEQGALQGSLTSVVSISSIIGPLLMTSVFKFFTHKDNAHIYFPGAPFLLASFLFLIALLIIIFSLKRNQ